MKQAELERAVCRATGESREVIRHLGFSLMVPPTRNVLPPVRVRRRLRFLTRRSQVQLVAA